MRRRFYPALLLVLVLLLAGCTMGVTKYGDLRGYVGIRVNPGIQSQEITLGEINPEDLVISSQAFADDNIIPLAGAKVYISGQKGYVPTEQDGVFRAYRLPVGWKTVTISHPMLRTDLVKRDVWVGEGPNTMPDAIGGVGYYIVIGIEDYKYSSIIPKASGAINDAQSVVDVFERYTKLPGYVLSLLGSQATRENIEDAIVNIPGLVTPDDYLVIYFAGHMGSDFLSPWDDTGSWSNAITDVNLESWLRKFPGDVTVILDGAESATFADGSGFRPQALKKPKYTVITSSKVEQEAIVVESGHGLFTHYLIAGLSTPEEREKSDRNRDGVITAQEIFNYIKSGMEYYQMAKYREVIQEPVLHVGSLDNTVILRY